MELCFHGHTEICHEQINCPICELLEKNKIEYDIALEQKDTIITELQDQVKDLKK